MSTRNMLHKSHRVLSLPQVYIKKGNTMFVSLSTYISENAQGCALHTTTRKVRFKTRSLVGMSFLMFR